MLRKKALIALLPLLLPMCGGGNDGANNPNNLPLSPSVNRQALVRVYLTDKPADEFTEVNVTISAVRMHRSASAGEAEGGWIDLPVVADMPQDLLKLRDGVLMPLCDLEKLPVGNYQQVRLALTPNAGSGPSYNNSVKTASGTTHPLDVPSGTIKIVHPFSVVEGQTTDLTLDFDASQSVKRRGNGTYFMTPVIKASSEMRKTAD